MFSRITRMLHRAGELGKHHPFNPSRKSNKMVIHKQALDEYEYLRSIVEELNNVAVDLYREGDFKTAIVDYEWFSHNVLHKVSINIEKIFSRMTGFVIPTIARNVSCQLILHETAQPIFMVITL
mmetsp:Transcript_57621/g.68778  ORF Transcript_57621/g.68778 Transcript_57621/m.68778 type:complete len:124 (+) Transcript_57621:127-498(+)